MIIFMLNNAKNSWHDYQIHQPAVIHSKMMKGYQRRFDLL